MNIPDTTEAVRNDIHRCIQRIEWELGPSVSNIWAQTFLQNAINLLDGYDIKDSLLPQDVR